GFSHEDPNETAIALVKAKKPDLVVVAYGSPKQEFWMHQAAQELPDVESFIGIGGALDFWSGHIKRAPLFLRKLGLEWLWRLFLEPKKRFKRIWTAVVKFPLISLFSE
ncbi:MAG: WecB/TagA/CpsF family glycosyltransferase, partial [Patescibacteria group bacterium]